MYVLLRKSSIGSLKKTIATPIETAHNTVHIGHCHRLTARLMLMTSQLQLAGHSNTYIHANNSLSHTVFELSSLYLAPGLAAFPGAGLCT